MKKLFMYIFAAVLLVGCSDEKTLNCERETNVKVTAYTQFDRVEITFDGKKVKTYKKTETLTYQDNESAQHVYDILSKSITYDEIAINNNRIIGIKYDKYIDLKTRTEFKTDLEQEGWTCN